MPEEAVEILKELLQEVRSVRAELTLMRNDVSMLVDDRRQAVKMQSPLMGKDLFNAAGEHASPRNS